MKYVQFGILAALILVAALLGLNLFNDRPALPGEGADGAASAPAVSTATVVPAAAPADLGEPATAAEPVESPASGPTSPTSASGPANGRAVPATRPTASKPPSASGKPSPGGSEADIRTAPAAAGTSQEVASVEPPAAMPDTRTLPSPPVAPPATPSTTEQYEIMRPESKLSSAATAPEPPRTVTIPAGTILTIRTIQTLSSKSNGAGDTFTGTLDQPLVLEDMVIAERGSRVEGKVSAVTESGRVKGLAQMSITLTRINTSDGQTADVHTQDFLVEAEKTTKSDATKIGIATGIGAALGAIFGGGKGAAIGAASGGAAGAGTVLLSKGKPAEIPSETRINFRLEKPLTLTEKINAQ